MASIIGATRFHHFFFFFWAMAAWPSSALQPSPTRYAPLVAVRQAPAFETCECQFLHFKLRCQFASKSPCEHFLHTTHCPSRHLRLWRQNRRQLSSPSRDGYGSHPCLSYQALVDWQVDFIQIEERDCGISKPFCNICSVNAEENAPHRVPSHHRSRFARSAPERSTIFADKATRKSMEGGQLEMSTRSDLGDLGDFDFADSFIPRDQLCFQTRSRT